VNSGCAADLHIQQASIGFRSPVLWMTDTSPVWGSGSLALAVYGLAAGPSIVRPQLTPTISRHANVPRSLSVQGKALLYARCSSATGLPRSVLYASHGALRNLSLYPLSYGIRFFAHTSSIKEYTGISLFVQTHYIKQKEHCQAVCRSGNCLNLDTNTLEKDVHGLTRRNLAGERRRQCRGYSCKLLLLRHFSTIRGDGCPHNLNL
jgi:hypothetical protein